MPYAGREFLRSLRWIAVAGALMVAGSLWYLSLYGPLCPSIVIDNGGRVPVGAIG
jgi:hypothetical protein